MASIKYSGLILGIKGTIAGTTFQGGRAVNQIKTKPRVIPTYRNLKHGANNVTQKSAFSYLSQVWRTLTATERLTWSTNASLFPQTNKFGDIYTPSAFQLFCKLNLVSFLYGTALQTSAPVNYSFAAFNPDYVEEVSTSACFIYLVSTADDNTKVEVMATTSLSKGSKSPRGGFKLIGWFPVPTDAYIEVHSQYNAVFPQIIAGCNVIFKLRLINIHTGEATAWQYTIGATS